MLLELETLLSWAIFDEVRNETGAGIMYSWTGLPKRCTLLKFHIPTQRIDHGAFYGPSPFMR